MPLIQTWNPRPGCLWNRIQPAKYIYTRSTMVNVPSSELGHPHPLSIKGVCPNSDGRHTPWPCYWWWVDDWLKEDEGVVERVWCSLVFVMPFPAGSGVNVDTVRHPMGVGLSSTKAVTLTYVKGYFWLSYIFKHCFICRPSDSTASKDVVIEPRPLQTVCIGRQTPISTTWPDLIHNSLD